MSSALYKTLAAPSESQYRVLGSRHLGYAFPVRTEEEIKERIDQLWKEHHNATHVCYAWRLGWDKNRYRVNDDGEPSGTAGRPIYGQIQSFDLTHVLIAVVRYYGGTKLGTGGLIDAYKTASKLAIEAGKIIELEARDHFKMQFAHEDMPKVMKLLKDLDMEKLSMQFEMQCHIEFLISKTKTAQLQHQAAEWGIEQLEFLGIV